MWSTVRSLVKRLYLDIGRRINRSQQQRRSEPEREQQQPLRAQPSPQDSDLSLQRMALRYRELFTEIPTPVVIIKNSGEIIDINRSDQKLLRLDQAPLLKNALTYFMQDQDFWSNFMY